MTNRFAAVGTYFRRIILIAQKAANRTPNTGNVYIGNSQTYQPITLTAGDQYTIEADTGGKRDLGSWWISSDVAGEGVTIVGA